MAERSLADSAMLERRFAANTKPCWFVNELMTAFWTLVGRLGRGPLRAKGMTMKTLLIGLVALVGIAIVTPSADASAGGWRRRRARVYYAPAPAVTVAQGQAGTGYRTYSYQPETYSQPASGYRSYSRTPASGFRDAGAKIRGEF